MTGRRPLFIIGTSGLAREMAQLVRHVDPANRIWDVHGFIGPVEASKALSDGRVLGDDAWLLDQDIEADLVIAIGHPAIRARALAPYLLRGDRFAYPNVVHPSAVLDTPQVALGRGNLVTAGCVLTTDIRIGDFNLLNWHVTIGHDVQLGSFNVVNPGVNVSGGVTIGDRVLIGTGAQVLEGRAIGSDASVGAGAVVTHDVEPGVTVVGVPARPRAGAGG
jgi:sugar O-acyltransferase (sialic acid O-acetyltransferase NeuD family)